jgi:hypothetical protein
MKRQLASAGSPIEKYAGDQYTHINSLLFPDIAELSYHRAP